MHAVESLTLPLLIGAMAALVAVVASGLTHRFSLPAPAVFLGFGVAVNAVSDSARSFIDVNEVIQIGIVALVLILFEGGFSSGVHRMRRSLGPVSALGIVGTLLTAGMLAAAAHAVLGTSWETSTLIAVALAPTDPAAVFSVLGNRDVRGRSSAIIEGESGANDPVSIVLMLATLAYIAGDANVGESIVEFVQQLVEGVLTGGLLGLVAGRVLAGMRLRTESLFPVAAIAAAFAVYAIADIVHGSGFLAVLVAGLVMGDQLREHRGIESLVGLGAALAEIVMFSVLGLTADLGDISTHMWGGLAMFAILTFAVRPIVIAGLLWPARLDWAERVFVMWGGLKGAVPVLLAAFVVAAEVEGAARVYAIVFVAVAASVLVQGTTLPWLIDRLDLVDEPPVEGRRYFPN